MRKFEGHIHTFLFKIPIRDSLHLFQREFDRFGVEKATFLSIPCEPVPGKIGFDQTDRLDNIRVMYHKAAFSPNGYAYAGLEYCDLDLQDTGALSQALLEQVKRYKQLGYDGMKMFEGHPNTRKCIGYPLDHEVFDPYFDFCEKENYPIIMHVANPPEHWDTANVSDYWKGRGCCFDDSYPTFDELLHEVLRRLDKNPKLNFTLAHFGFLTSRKEIAEKYMSYPNTKLDICPGSEYVFNMLKDTDYWVPFIEKYVDRFFYGTDCYTFEYDNEENWLRLTGMRPNLVERFFTTSDTHDYLGNPYRGIGLKEELCQKIFYDNLANMLGQPKPIDFDYFIGKCEEFLQTEPAETLEHYNLWCMLNDFRSMKNGEFDFKR